MRGQQHGLRLPQAAVGAVRAVASDAPAAMQSPADAATVTAAAANARPSAARATTATEAAAKANDDAAHAMTTASYAARHAFALLPGFGTGSPPTSSVRDRCAS